MTFDRQKLERLGAKFGRRRAQCRRQASTPGRASRLDPTREQYLRTPAVQGSGFERPNPLIAGGPDPNAVIRIRDRLAAHADAPAPEAR